MNTRKLKLGMELGFWVFVMLLLMVGLTVSMVQLYLINPVLLLIAILIIITPFAFIWFQIKFKIVRRE